MSTPIKHRQSLRGRVVSVSPDKTIVVEVVRYIKHPKYKKYFKRSKKYSAHTAGDRPKVGETVVLESSRPVSKTKKWIVVSNT